MVRLVFYSDYFRKIDLYGKERKWRCRKIDVIIVRREREVKWVKFMIVVVGIERKEKILEMYYIRKWVC